ncbi:MAG: metalloregulator ArsR/SmtB family transcription factor [Chloroflexota bacterium]|jgi:DNA-binding transcriptional ArsR family regulator
MARGTIERRPTRPVRTVGARAASFAVEFDARTGYEFLVSAGLGEAAENDLAPADREWLQQARASLTQEQREHIDRLFGAYCLAALDGLPTLVIARPEVRTGADVVRLLEATPPSTLIARTLRECVTEAVPEDVIERASNGDVGALDAIGPLLCAPEVDPIVREFATDSERLMRVAIDIARAWLVAFEPIEARLARMHAADMALRRADLASLAPEDAVERITGGLHLVPEARIRRVLLAPSVFVRPFNFVHQDGDWRMFWYPVADEVLETDAGAPSAAMVRLFRALGDPNRLQVLRLLTDRDWYLTELATKLELSKPTMKHHLALLRAAGLVTVMEEGSLTYYRLRRERLTEGGSELRRYLRA